VIRNLYLPGGLLWLTLASAGGIAQSTSTALKVGTIDLQNALLKTRDGQAAQRDFRTRAEQKEAALKDLQTEIATLRERLNKSNAVASAERQESLAREIDQKTKTFNRRLEDSQAEMDQEQARALNELGNRMLRIVEQYAARAGYSLILDVSESRSNVLFAAPVMDVTADVVRLFDDSSSPKPQPDAGRPPK